MILHLCGMVTSYMVDVNAVVQYFTGNLNVIMIVSGLELCCHCSYYFHTVLYTLSSYIIYSDALQENGYHKFESCILKCVDFTYVYAQLYKGLPHIYQSIIQNKHILHMKTGYMLDNFFVLVEQIPQYDIQGLYGHLN